MSWSVGVEEEENKESLIISLWRYNGLVLIVNARAIVVPLMVAAEGNKPSLFLFHFFSFQYEYLIIVVRF